MDPKVKAIIDGAEDYVPPAPSKIISGDFRPRITLPGPHRTPEAFACDLVKLLADKQIFNHGGIVSIVDDKTYALRRMTPTKFRTWIESDGGVVCQAWAGKGDDAGLADMGMAEETARAVLDCGSFIRGLREVVRVNTVRLPVRRENGTVELLPPGYDPESKILTIVTVDYDTEMPELKALEVFNDLLKDTAFDNRG